MPFPPKKPAADEPPDIPTAQTGAPQPQQFQNTPPPGQPGAPQVSDGKVDAYQRVVNGKIVKVNAYGKTPSTSTEAAIEARKIPGRPQMMGMPGTYAGGRDLPGVMAKPKPPPPMPMIPQMGAPGAAKKPKPFGGPPK